jgi:hypothetical protein
MLIADLLSAKYCQGTQSLCQRFNAAEPFRYLVLDDFFQPAVAEKLRQDFPAFDTAKAMNEDGNIGAKCVHEQLSPLGGDYARLDELIQTPAFLGWLGAITGIEEPLLYDPYYFGGGTHENRHGQDLDPHVDFNKHPKTGHHRRLNLIVYLNEEWQDDWGGAIEFHKDPRLPKEQNEVTHVAPAFNRAVLFETTYWSWHGFQRIQLPDGDADERSRKSLALYFYSETRPEAEQTKPHSTIYVERPLPDDIQPGVTLTEEQYRALGVLLARRDQHLQRLYRKIEDLNGFNEELLEARDKAYGMLSALQGGDANKPPSRRLDHRARRWLARKLLAFRQ